jgi:hypothetical protein
VREDLSGKLHHQDRLHRSEAQAGFHGDRRIQVRKMRFLHELLQIQGYFESMREEV